jgi:hypothetical protein
MGMAEEKTAETAAAPAAANTPEMKDGPGCFAIGGIVLLIAIIVGFGLLVGMCGLKL